MPSPRLTIELVPQSCWFSNLRSHLDKHSWDRLRKQAYRDAGYRCEVCGGRGSQWPVECHECWTYDDRNHIQKLTGLTALCPRCHEVKHIGLAGAQGKYIAARQHLMRVNGWTTRQAEAHIREAFDIWQERSRHDWALDVSWLKRHGIKIQVKS